VAVEVRVDGRLVALGAPKQRAVLAMLALQLLAARAPTVPLVNEQFVSLTAKGLANYQHHPVSGPLLDQLWVK
jgi:hypothetical protein